MNARQSKLTTMVAELFRKEKKPRRGLIAVEWIAVGYMVLTLIMMALLWTKLPTAADMLSGRFHYAAATAAMWLVYRLLPCRLTMLLRVVVQMLFLSWWYPDTYELNRVLPNLDHLFAGYEQAVFGCQPALLFAQHMPWGWFSELMCMSYLSYFPLIVLLCLYYFFRRQKEFHTAVFTVMASFFTYYVIFVLLPVTGPQYYYLAAGTDNIAAGEFPKLTDWFLTHSERMAAPGWAEGYFHQLLDAMHDTGERPTAAFPSSHVGITTVVLLLAWRTRCRWLTWLVAVCLGLMCLSTVYLLAHYAIDVIGGLVTGSVFFVFFKFVHNRWCKTEK